MKVKSDAHLYLTETDATPPVPVAVTGISNANPAVVTPGAASAAVGDMVTFDGTGEPLLDGNTFRLTAVTGSTSFAIDFDGTQLSAAVAVGTFTLYHKGAGGLIEACLASVTVTGQDPDSIALDDMCSTATVLGDPKPPTFQFSGFTDKESAGFRNLVQASIESPKQERMLLIDYGPDAGYIFGPAEIGSISVAANVGQGLQFSGSGVFTEVPTYSWAL